MLQNPVKGNNLYGTLWQHLVHIMTMENGC